MKRVILSILALALFVCSAKAQLLYKISGNGLSKPSYIVGTFHLAPATIIDEIPGAREALNSVEQVCGEIDLDEATTLEHEPLMQHVHLLPFSLRIDDVLSDEEMDRLNAFMHKKLGYDYTSDYIYATMSALRPSSLASEFANMMFAEAIPNYEAGNYMDAYFQSEAQRLNKGYTALESVEFQMELLYGPTTIEKEREELLFIVDYPDIYEFGIHQIVDAYYSQNLRELSRALKYAGGKEDSFDDVMIVRRNNNWIELMPKMMAEHSTLFVVGSAHLPQRYGMIRLLRKAGYKVTPVKKEKQVS